MKIKKHFLFAVSAFSIAGCSNNSKLPLPEGDKISLNQNGIPADLVVEINREKQPMLPTVPVKKDTPKITAPVVDFSHAKNTSVPQTSAKAVASNKYDLSKNNNIQASPFSVDRKGLSTNSIVPDKLKLPIVPDKQALNSTNVKAATSPTPIPLIKPINLTPIKVIDTGKLWVAESGQTLRSTLIKWSDQDKCNLNDKWRVIWPVQVDYPIDSNLTFRGNFFEVVSKLFDLYKKADKPLYLDIYKSQCILSVTDTTNNK